MNKNESKRIIREARQRRRQERDALCSCTECPPCPRAFRAEEYRRLVERYGEPVDSTLTLGLEARG